MKPVNQHNNVQNHHRRYTIKVDPKAKAKVKGKGTLPWEPHHTHILTRAIIHQVLSSRSALYQTEGLAGEVDANGGDRISKKVVQACNALAKGAGMDPCVVQEEISKLRGGSSRKRSHQGDREEEGAGSKKVRERQRKVKRQIPKKMIDWDEE